MSVQNKLMNNDKSSTNCSQELRTEYYNDFDDCLREYKSQKVAPKEDKVHMSDGSDSQSDTETYVDASSYQSPKSMSSYRTLTNIESSSITNTLSIDNTACNSNTEIDSKIDSLSEATRIINRSNYAPHRLENYRDPPKPAQNLFKVVQAAETAAEKPVKKPPQQETVVGKLEIKIVEKPAKIEDNKKIDSGTSSSSSSKQTSSSDKFSEECPIKMEKLEKSVKTLAPTKSVKQSPIKPSSPSKNATRTPANEKSPIKRPIMTVTCANGSDSKMNSMDSSWGQERSVELVRELNKSFGISIVGGKVNVSGDSLVSGIFIKTIIPDSPADRSARLRVGDRILAVDGNDIRHSSHEIAVKTIKNASERMTLLVQSLNQGSDTSTPPVDMMRKVPPPVTPTLTPVPELIQEGSSLKNGSVKKAAPSTNGLNTLSEPEQEEERTGTTPLPPDTESDDSSDDEDTREMEGKCYTKGNMEIDRASAGNVKRSTEEIQADPDQEDAFGYTNNKIKKRYGALGQVLCHTIDRGQSSTNIGISLAGHRDRTKMACFIAGINPKGIASATQLEIGDEILEVNGIVLYGRCHLNASAIIKGLTGNVLQLIVLRRKQAVDDLAVKPVTQFPVEITNEDAFAQFKNVKHVTIKKGNQSLGIMIIEGKHAEVGQGIFVSDIQEGSNAEKAGLNIGDLILAVNKDSLLGCTYESAANMLKKTEGVVTLTVCNPNKKDEVKKDTVDTVSVGSKGPSRPITPKPEPSPAKVVPVDPTTCDIKLNENTLIEMKLENKPIGIQVAGGCDTLVNTGAVIVNITPEGVTAKDNRLQVFDQILEINANKITTEMNQEQIQRLIKQVQSKVKMIVYRAEPSEAQPMDIELSKKSGKILGLGFFVGNAKGLFITDIIPGGAADSDGRIQKGDILTHVNSESISNMPLEECSALLKTAQGKVALKILRAKPKKRVLEK